MIFHEATGKQIKILLDKIKKIISGETQVGDSAKLGGKRAEEWQGEIDSIVLKEAKEVYVSPSGSDENGDGTAENPWATIQKAVDECPSGNSGGDSEIYYRINLYDGTYSGSKIRIDHKSSVYIQGVSESPNITIQNEISIGDSFVAITSPITIDGSIHKTYCIRVNGRAYLTVTKPLTIIGASSSNGRGINVGANGGAFIQGTISLSNLHTALYAERSGKLFLESTITIDNCTYGFRCFGGEIRYVTTPIYTNVVEQADTGWGGRIYTGEQNELTTANKPTGTYTGNGSATERVINTGGIGDALLFKSGGQIGLISRFGGVVFSLDSAKTTYYKEGELNFTGGVLTIATNSLYVNGNGSNYYYQVL